MENNSISNDSIQIFDKSIIELVKRQTNYDEKKIMEKLKEWDNDHTSVIKEYLNPNFNKIKKTPNKQSTNQMIMTEIRNFMNNVSYNRKL